MSAYTVVRVWNACCSMPGPITLESAVDYPLFWPLIGYIPVKGCAHLTCWDILCLPEHSCPRFFSMNAGIECVIIGGGGERMEKGTQKLDHS